jgi:hypothetical protein
MHGASGRPRWAGEKDLEYWRTFLAKAGSPGSRLARTRLLWGYLGHVYATRPGIDAAGFKLMYSQLKVSRPLLPALVLRRVRIVHLIRRNALDVVLSKETAAAREAMHARAGEAVQPVRVLLPTDDLLERMAAHERHVEQARERFARLARLGLAYREAVYEDLVRDEQREFTALFDFLHVGSNAGTAFSSLQKVNPTSHQELIENYDEVRGMLRGTRFEPFLH